MTGADLLLSALLRAPQRVFSVADAAAWTGLGPVALSRALAKAARVGAVLRLKRGVWASLAAGRPHPFEAVPYLCAPWPACVSLHSALAEHGLIAEVPPVTYAVTAGPPLRLRTPLGDYSFHHLPARLVWGYEVRRTPGAAYPLADPEKAFLDTLYLALAPRSPVRAPVPREADWGLDRAALRAYATRIGSERVWERLKAEGLLPARVRPPRACASGAGPRPPASRRRRPAP